ncbi:hypothetical protein BZA77DRAFT_44627 [Pyronema omphalodes]|nr:hypothetical protein BZA77DRAFT_44627 [Pyronema omphalodes]
MSGHSSSKAAIDKAASKEAFLRERQRLAELEWERAQAQGDAFDGDDDDDGLRVPETQLPSLDIDGCASEIEDVAGKNVVIATSEGSKSEGRKAAYKLRKTLAARMGLDPKDSIGIRERRDYLRMLCARRNQPLNKPFNTFYQNIMYKLIKIVAPEMKELYGGCWTSKLTRGVIHALCLDKVRNDNPRQRQWAAKAILSMSASKQEPRRRETVYPRRSFARKRRFLRSKRRIFKIKRRIFRSKRRRRARKRRV